MNFKRNILLAATLAWAMNTHADSDGPAMADRDPAPGTPGSWNADRWEFKVTLDDREIGYHNFEVRQHDGLEQIDSEARFKVNVLFITAYKYAHDNSETWKNDCLRSIESVTNDNGTDYDISGAVTSEGFSLLRNEVRTALEQECVQTFAYWNPGILEAQRLLNSQTGEVEPVQIDFLGEKNVVVDGLNVPSDEYVISTPNGDIKVWYAQANGQWLGLETLTEGDRLLRYEPVIIPGSLRAHDLTAGIINAP